MLTKASLLLLGGSIYKVVRFISQWLNNRNQLVAVDDRSKDYLILSQMVYPPPTKYDVFLSFRGEDTRHTFASYLHKGLNNAGVYTFMDHELRKGEQISPVLLRTIEASEISLIILSENYASSTWCMDELVHILECKKKFGRTVIPIFYNVNPSDIRKQNGSFGKRFDELKRRFKDNEEKLEKWRKALVQSTSLSGWDSNNTRPEFKLVVEIVKDILSKLNCKSSSHLERLVGIVGHIENIEKLLNEAHIVGIWGMGGAGKTTLAKAVFQELKAQFDAFSFVENVKEQLGRISLDELQKNCLKELLKDEDINIYDIKSNSVKSRLQRKKILLILDDVDNSIIVEDLIKVCDWFGEGSRIIITSRNKQVIKNASAFSTYQVPELDFNDAFYLFSLKAFKQHEPSDRYMESSTSVVEYCQGNPLALVVLGCFLYGRGTKEWESALEKLNEAPPKDIVDVLKLSFDGLDYKQQNVFLDIAFLIKEEVSISVNLIRQLYGSSVHIEISVLSEKSLISFDSHADSIGMHNLVRKMGLEIARQQLLSSLKTPLRLWRHEDINYVFICEKEIDAIRCLSLDLSKIKRFTWRASNFQKMHNLIFFEVYKSDGRKPSELTICDDLDYLPEEIRFFSWEEYPLPYVPLHFCSENLIRLKMPNSNIRQLWNENQHFPNLKEIDLRGSKYLIAVPDLSHAPNIERMCFEGCVNLAEIHSSIVLGNIANVSLDSDGPKRINIGGNIKETRPGLVMVYSYLDLEKSSFHKMKMKLFGCGKILSGFRFKHVEMPLAEMAELRSLLPFVRKVILLRRATEFQDDFNQHYDYDSDYCRFGWLFLMLVRVDNGKRHAVGPLRREMIEDNEREMKNDDQLAMTLMEGEEEEDDDELIAEYCGSNGATLTRIPDSIARWSLLMTLRLKESEVSRKAGCLNVRDATLKSLNALSRGSYKGIQPLLDLTLSLDIPSPAFLRDYHFAISYSSNIGHPNYPYWFRCYVRNSLSLYPTYDWAFENGHCTIS